MTGRAGCESAGQAGPVRRGWLAAGAAVVVVALGAVWWATARPGDEPAAQTALTTPSPAASPTPAAPPTATASPAPAVLELGAPIDEVGVPTYYAMPDGALDLAEPGWVLATYLARPLPLVTVPGHTTGELVFIVRPDGTRLLAVRIPQPVDLDAAGTTWTEHEVLAWAAGARTAVVREVVHTVSDAGSESRTPGAVLTLDLLTGELTAGATEPAAAAGAPNSRGDLWLTEGNAVVDATGTQLGVIDGPTASGWCQAVDWWTADSLLAACADQDPILTELPHLQLNPRLVTIKVADLATGSGTVLRPIAPDEPWPSAFGSASVGDGVVVAQGTVLGPDAQLWYSCPTGLYLLDARGGQRLPASDDPEVELNIFTPTAVGGVVYVSATGGCSGDARPSVLTSYDAATGAFMELVGAPPRGGATEYPWLQGLTSYVVGH